MRIDLNEIPIHDIVLYNKETQKCEGFIDNEEEGVYGMDGNLNIRPIYQREFIYKVKAKESVINTVRNNFPLNVLYWMENKTGSYEVLDGQQRLMSICKFISSDYSVEWPGLGRVYFHNLSDSQQDQMLNYKLMVYFCVGTDSERLDWFQTINITGEKLTDQEIKNAIFSGPWVSDAKKYFSRTAGPAFHLAHTYLGGSANRQDYLETAIKWISNEKIQEYMSLNQHNENAKDLWQYFKKVIGWVESIFTVYRKEMKGLPFGLLYNKYKDCQYNSTEVEVKVRQLMIDEDVENKKGIYLYIFTGNEKQLQIRLFSDKQKRETYEKQKGICVHCKECFEIKRMEGDHITSWAKGGHTVSENCQMLCIKCNREKGSK
jgi:uncharacterized protein with ParB-like and HNH nuclease domain